MALVLLDRVQQQGTANTTVSFTLTTSVTGFQSFTAIGNGNTTYYGASDSSGNWEAGIGTYATGGTLTRTTILASSNTGSAVTFSGTVNVFVTYPAEKSINLDGSGNSSPLGTVASGTWQGSTVGVAYGGTGVTASTGANSVVLRDANQNISANNLALGFTSIVTAGGITTLTAASTQYQRFTGTTTQTVKFPDATTLLKGVVFFVDGDSTGNIAIVDSTSVSIGTTTAGSVDYWVLLDNGTVAGTWVAYSLLPAAYDFGVTSASFGNATISSAVWQGTTVASGYGGTGLTTFTAANNALYSTSAGALAAGTLPVAAGGTGQTSLASVTVGAATTATNQSGGTVSATTGGFSGAVTFAGGSKIDAAGDVYARRSNGTTGVYYFVDGGAKYLYYDGTNFIFSGGNVSAPNLSGTNTGDQTNISGNAATATSATSLNSSNYISQHGSDGSWNADFQNTPAGTYRYNGDVGANGVNGPGGSWWVQNNYRHTNGSNYWGTQVAWGWEDNANRLATRNISGGTFGAWAYYFNTINSPLSAAANGYQKFASGLIIQWGTLTADGAGNYTITLPIAFPSACVSFAGAPHTATSFTGGLQYISLGTASISGYVANSGNVSKWMAIGY